MLVGVVELAIGIAISVTWLIAAKWASSAYGIDTGDLFYYWHAAQDPVVCWLAYGPLPFFIAGGFIVCYSIVDEKIGKQKSLRYIAYLVAGFLACLFFTVTFSLLHWSISVGDILLYGNLFVTMLLLVIAILVFYKEYRRASKAHRITIRKTSTPASIGLFIGIMFNLIWSIVIDRAIIFILSGHYSMKTIDRLLFNDPTLYWLRSGFAPFFIMLSAFLAYAIFYYHKPEYTGITYISLNYTSYVFVGTIAWLVLCIAMSLLQIKMASHIAESAGLLIIAALLLFTDDPAAFFSAFSKCSSSGGNISP